MLLSCQTNRLQHDCYVPSVGHAVVMLWSCCGDAVVVLWSCCGVVVYLLPQLLSPAPPSPLPLPALPPGPSGSEESDHNHHNICILEYIKSNILIIELIRIEYSVIE